MIERAIIHTVRLLPRSSPYLVPGNALLLLCICCEKVPILNEVLGFDVMCTGAIEG